eukprot:gene1326-biopygen1879
MRRAAKTIMPIVCRPYVPPSIDATVPKEERDADAPQLIANPDDLAAHLLPSLPAENTCRNATHADTLVG